MRVCSLLGNSVLALLCSVVFQTPSLAETGPGRVRIAQTSAAQPASTLPGGASSLNEAYRDWNVACVQQGTGKRCVISQTQTQPNGQRVFAIELNPPTGNVVTGVLLMPLGLALDAGTVLQVDDKPATQPLRFRACVQAGCVVPLSFDATMIAALRSGEALKIKATADGGREGQFSASLQGFGNALDRLVVLSR